MASAQRDEGIQTLRKSFPLLTGEYPLPDTPTAPRQIADKKAKLAAVVRSRLDELPLPGDVRSDAEAALGLDKAAEEIFSRAGSSQAAAVAAPPTRLRPRPVQGQHSIPPP
jgi:hypothetical protein